MANVKITQLPLATTPLTGTEVFPLVQGTTTKQVAITGLFTSPVMTNPTLGTVGQADLINATGLPISTGVAGLGTGVATFLGTPTSANLRAAVTDETGTGSLVFATSPTLVTPNLGTPTAMVATNITGTALGLIAGSAITNANLTGAVTSVGNATSLGSFTSAQLATALTDETGSGANVFATSPTLVTPILGTPQSGNFSTGTFTWPTFNQNTTGTASNVTGTVAILNGGTGQTTANAAFNALAPSQTGQTGKYLTTDGTNTSWGANPLGDVVGPASATNNALARFDGTTGKLLKDSSTLTYDGTLLTVGDSTLVTGLTPLSVLISTNTSTGQVLNVRKSCDTALAANISLLKSRGTAASPVVVNVGDSAGNVIYSAFAGTNYRQLASVSCSVEAYVSDTNISGYLIFSTNSASVGTAEKMRLSSNGVLGIGYTSLTSVGDNGLAVLGNVGIGTSSPNAPLTFASTTGRKVGFYQGTQGYSIGVESSEFRFVTDSSAVFSWRNGSTYSSSTEYMRLDSAGNLGLGIAPSAWLSTYKAFQNGRSSFVNDDSGRLQIMSNAFVNSAGSYRYIASTFAALDWYISGERRWYTAPSGTAGDAISFTQAMTLDASGNLGVGTTNPSGFSSKFAVVGNASVTAGNQFLCWDSTNTYVYTISASGDALTFGKSGVGERARIDSSGNFGLGTTSITSGTNQKVLEVSAASYATLRGNAVTGGTVTYEITANNQSNWVFFGATTNHPLTFGTNSIERVRIDTSGNLLVGTTSQYGSAKLSVNGSVTATSGWTGTNSSAGKLGGIVQSFFCERNGVGTITQVMAYGNGAGLGKGLRMPFAGKLLVATLSGTGITGTVTVDVYQNGTANTSYRLTATATAADIGVTQDFSSSPLSFAAGDTIGWQQTAVPTAANVYNVAYYVIFD